MVSTSTTSRKQQRRGGVEAIADLNVFVMESDHFSAACMNGPWSAQRSFSCQD